MERTEGIRSWNDIRQDNVKHMKKAQKFYQALATRLINNGHTVDIFACSLDQQGVTEMKNCCENTGGSLVLGETFSSPMYKDTLKRFFALAVAMVGLIEVQASRDVRVMGAIGAITSQAVKSNLVSENEIGYGGTTCWKVIQNVHVYLYFFRPIPYCQHQRTPSTLILLQRQKPFPACLIPIVTSNLLPPINMLLVSTEYASRPKP